MDNSRSKVFGARAISDDEYDRFMAAIKDKYPKIANYIRFDCPICMDPKSFYLSVADYPVFIENEILSQLKEHMANDTVRYYGTNYPIKF